MGRIPTLAINEIFGPTFQGEGVNLGMPVMFLRLAGCNLACVWCDSKYSWDWKNFDKDKEITKYTVDQLMEIFEDAPIKNLVITGGEPMLQQKALGVLTKRLHALGWHTEIETAGTIVPDTSELVKQWTISPKLSNSENTDKRINPEALTTFSHITRKAFKFVVNDKKDLKEVDELVSRFNLSPVYIMPMGIDADDIDRITKDIIDDAIERGYYITTRLHILAYGNIRAV